MTIAEAIAQAAGRLAAHKIENNRLDAEVLLGHVLNRDRAWLAAHYPDRIGSEEIRFYARLVERRSVREPLQYITGRQEFWGIDFLVTPDVLIPRPETELVVEAALNALSGVPEPLVIDLCTGSGCIAVSVAKQMPGAEVYATDCSAKALDVAKINARRVDADQHIVFNEGDLFGSLNAGMEGSVDVITANPPYVRSSELPTLQPEVRDFEPELALISGPEGTEIAERIIAESPRFLRPGGALIMEFGMGQAGALRSLAEKTGAYAPVDVLKDLAGIERVIVARRK